ncbi:MAG TPA: DNA adenine methylase [Planctomycetota bacterium]|nr:DNA adenine methylase [Planctomycetota bacterium]HRR78906.1 DNA adenine methylase [Planctomycetota bacterium]HRT92816.1 DNA adenine methylase [Planctomycetota bacterium]
MAATDKAIVLAPPATQLTLWTDHPVGEDTQFLSRQLITCIGNKRSLLGPINDAVAVVKRRLGKNRLRVLDAFSGSGVVSRYLKAHATYLASNDIEDFATVAARCYLRNRSEVTMETLHEAVDCLNRRVDDTGFSPGFIEELYAPRDEHHMTRDDRAFYTRLNAKRLDNYRRLLDSVDAELRDMLLGPLLSEASVHANTAGVFKGFYKDRHTKIGRFGGSNSDALTRIKGEIRLEVPVLSRFECDVQVFQQDANAVVRHIRDLDLAYFDPPYNQHPYGSNYFMLNLLVHYKRPERISRVSGIPVDWRRSDYNIRSRCLPALRALLQAVDAKFILLSFNDEGFICPDAMRQLLAEVGSVQVIETRYNTFRGSRNLRNRSIHVTEQLFLVERR